MFNSLSRYVLYIHIYVLVQLHYLFCTKKSKSTHQVCNANRFETPKKLCMRNIYVYTVQCTQTHAQIQRFYDSQDHDGNEDDDNAGNTIETAQFTRRKSKVRTVFDDLRDIRTIQMYINIRTMSTMLKRVTLSHRYPLLVANQPNDFALDFLFATNIDVVQLKLVKNLVLFIIILSYAMYAFYTKIYAVTRM